MKNILSLLAFIIITFSTHSQTFHLEPTVQSPNVASLGTYGEVPISHFTGKPNISVPIYNLSTGNIKIPITLSYHPDNVKPSAQPGWAGFGWSLNPGGAITRKVNGKIDEEYDRFNDTTTSWWVPYYPYPGNLSAGQYHGANVINNNWNWASTASLLSYWTGSNDPNVRLTDVHPDEFHFNFMGYSGKFYYSGDTKGWEVVSDDKVKIELVEGEEFMEIEAIRDAIDAYIFHNNVSSAAVVQSRFFGKFKMTTPDGTQYFFGGENGVELSSSYAKRYVMFNVNTWRLVKIIDRFNNEVNLEYKRTYPTCSFSFSSQNSNYSLHTSGPGPTEGSDTWSVSKVSSSKLNGSFVWPLYLTKISSATLDVQFNSVAMDRNESLYYTDSQIQWPNKDLSQNDFDFYLVDNNSQNIKWEKLESISIHDKEVMNTNQQVREVHNFVYSSNPSQRLTLNEYYKTSHLNQELLHYFFDYNNMSAFNDITCDGNYSDHWGFFNNINADQAWPSEVYTKRAVNTTYLQYGLLKEIKYPTGGTTEFEWEPNDYSQVVAIDRQNLDNDGGVAGGVRIKEIRSYSKLNELASKKTYYYKRNYTNGADITSLPSSGILNVIPQYSISFVDRPFNISGPGTATIQAFRFNSLTGYGYTGQGNHVGYDQVVEKNLDGSYSKYFFTSYCADINNVSHFDKPPVNYIGFDPEIDKYMPHSLLGLERGKRVGLFHHKNDNTLIEKIITKYRSDSGRFNQYIRNIPFQIGIGTACCGLRIASASKIYTYNYYPVEQITTRYDLNGTNPIVNTEKYSYDTYNLLVTQRNYDSYGDSFVKQYSYPHNSSDQVFEAMHSKHILTPIIKQKVTKEGIQISSEETNYYEPHANIYVPSEITRQKEISQEKTILQQFLKFNDKGKLLEKTRENILKEIYIWGYNEEYLVAKILIHNKIYSDITNVLDMQLINAPSTSDSVMKDELQKIRTSFPSALVTTYTYDYTYGSVTSMTDPKGYTIYYEYDDFNRLKQVKDADRNIVSENKYHYKGQ